MPTALKFSKVYINQREQHPNESHKSLFIAGRELLERSSQVGRLPKARDQDAGSCALGPVKNSVNG